MLNLGKKEKIIYGEGEQAEVVDNEKINLEEFFVANLAVNVEFEEDLTLEGLLNHFGELRPFILTYFTEHYDRLKAIITSKKNNHHYVGIKFFKKLIVEEGKLYFIPGYDFITAGDGYNKMPFLAQLPVVVENKVKVVEEIPGEYFKKKEIDCDLTLQDVLEALFTDLVFDLTEGAIEG